MISLSKRPLTPPLLTGVIILLSAMMSVAGGQTTTALSQSHPFQIPEPLPFQGDVNVHDPFITKEGNTYYLFSTAGMVRISKSSDLIHWTRVGEVFSELPSWIKGVTPRANDIWAPEVFYWGGKWRMYYCASVFGTNDSCIGLVTNLTLNPNDPQYRWADEGMIMSTKPGVDDFNALDPSIAVDAQGNRWFLYGSFWGGIRMCALDSATGKPPPGVQHRFIASRPGNTAIEAAFVHRNDAWYYLFVSFDSCCKGMNSTYRTLVGRSDSIEGPYFDRLGKPMLDNGGTLVLTSSPRWRGQGHAMILKDGGRDYIVHHAYDGDNNASSTLQIRPLLWAGDGWPLAGELFPGKGRVHQRGSLTAADVVGEWIHCVNGAAVIPLRLKPDGTIASEKSKTATWTIEGTTLRLKWPAVDAPGGAWIDDCLVSPDAKWYTGRNQEDHLVRGVRR